MLDALRERTLALHPTPPGSKSGALHEEPAPYRTPGDK